MPRPRLSAVIPPDPSADQAVADQWQTAAEVAPAEVRWLLPGRIIAGTLSIVEGEAQTGKSTLLAAIAAAVTTGRAWLDRPAQMPADVLWLTAEEDPATMIRPRLSAAGYTPSRVHFPAATEDGRPRRIDLGGGLPLLADAIRHYRAALLVVEPLASHVPSDADLTRAADCRRLLDPVQQLAMQTGCTVLVTRGLRKDRSGPRLSHGQGNAAISDTARCVLVIDRPVQDAPRRILRVVRCGLAPTTPAVEYRIEPRDSGVVIAGLRELGRAEDDDSAADGDAGERDQRADARALLRRLCERDWVRSTVIQLAATDGCISISTLRRAKAELGMRTRQQYVAGSNYHEWGPPEGGWVLPTPTPPEREHLPTRVKSVRKKAAKKAPDPDDQTP